MRTKLLLTAFALSALFASCAKEELPTGKVETSERAIVENVIFSETAATRLSYNGEYNFEAGDQIGACLMDEITGSYASSSAKWYQKFDLVDYIQTNYKFTRDAEGNWETEAKMCEGNYFLAFPYNANSGLRKAYTFECADQVLAGTDDASLKEAFVDNNSFVGYAPVAKGDRDHESVAIDMAPVFESTGLVLFNTGSQSYTIEKIVLSGNKVSAKAVVKPSRVKSEVNNAGNFDFENKDVLDYTDATKRIEVALVGGNTVASNSSIRVIVMSAPSEKLTTDAKEAVLEIHTDKGLIRGIDLSHKYTAANGDNDNTGKDAINVTTDKALGQLGAAEVVTVTFDDTSLDVPVEMDINNADELMRFIQWNSNVNKVNAVANLLTNVNLTAEMYNILKTKYVDNGSTFAFKGGKQVTINADVEDGAINWVKFENASVVVKGTQTITNDEFASAVTVNSGATLNVNVAVANTITNKGTLNVNIAYVRGKGTDYYTIRKLVNKGTAIVDGYALYTELNNSKSLTVNSALVAGAGSVNTGVIDNYGVLDGSLVNKEYIEDVQNPTINNYGEIEAITNLNVIVIKDDKAAVNAAKGNGEIDNSIQSAYIKLDAIENTVVVAVADVKASELDELVKNANATKAYLSGEFTIDPETIDPKNAGGTIEVTKLTEVVANGNLTIKGKGIVTFTEAPEFVVAAGTKTEVKNGSHLSIKSGVLRVYGKMTIENNAQVTCGAYSGNITAYGKINKSENAKVTVSGVECVPVATQAALAEALTNGENVYIDAPGNYEIQDYSELASSDELVISGTTGVKVEFKDGNNSFNPSKFKKLIISNIEIKEMSQKWGMLTMGSTPSAGAHVCTISNCIFNGEGGQGIYINETNNGSVYNIENCTFKGDFGVEGAITIENHDDVDFTVNVKGCTFSIPSSSASKKIFVHNAYDGWTLNSDVTAYWKN